MSHSDYSPAPSILSPKSPLNKRYHPPAPPPTTSFYKHHHTRNKITSPAPASSYPVSPPTTKQQGLIFYLIYVQKIYLIYFVLWDKIYCITFCFIIICRSGRLSSITSNKGTKALCSFSPEARYHNSEFLFQLKTQRWAIWQFQSTVAFSVLQSGLHPLPFKCSNSLQFLLDMRHMALFDFMWFTWVF